jgi:hypothetical protein
MGFDIGLHKYRVASQDLLKGVYFNKAGPAICNSHQRRMMPLIHKYANASIELVLLCIRKNEIPAFYALKIYLAKPLVDNNNVC